MLIEAAKSDLLTEVKKVSLNRALHGSLRGGGEIRLDGMPDAMRDVSRWIASWIFWRCPMVWPRV